MEYRDNNREKKQRKIELYLESESCTKMGNTNNCNASCESPIIIFLLLYPGVKFDTTILI